MKKIEVPSGFDVNVFKCISEGLDSHIPTGPNIIGSSSASMCMRKTIIGKIYNIEKSNLNAKMLFGEIFEEIIAMPKVLGLLIIEINNRLNIHPKNMIIRPQIQLMIEVAPDKYFRVTPDIYTNLYLIEIKTTDMYVNNWKRELAANQVAQLNAQMGAFKIPLGFILKVNSRAFLSNIDDTKKTYWDDLWLKYGYLLPWEFKPEIYEATLNRVKFMFQCIDEGEFENVEGPEKDWECKYCNEEIRKYCGKEEFKCSEPKCYKTMYEYLDNISQKFYNFPLCKKHFKKYNPHSKYLKYKYINYKEIEKNEQV